MLNETIKDKLRSIYQAMDKVLLPEKGDGWVSMFDFQREVRKARINFKNLGTLFLFTRTALFMLFYQID